MINDPINPQNPPLPQDPNAQPPAEPNPNATVTADNTPIITAFAGIIVVYAIVVAAIAIFSPNQAATIIPILLATLAPVIPALLALIQSKQNAMKVQEVKQQNAALHVFINSRMGQLLDYTGQLAAANAVVAEKNKQAEIQAATVAASDTSSSTTTTTTLRSPASGDGTLAPVTEIVDIAPPETPATPPAPLSTETPPAKPPVIPGG